jgi:flagellar basal body L-ring protein FlgH
MYSAWREHRQNSGTLNSSSPKYNLTKLSAVLRSTDGMGGRSNSTYIKTGDDNNHYGGRGGAESDSSRGILVVNEFEVDVNGNNVPAEAAP